MEIKNIKELFDRYEENLDNWHQSHIELKKALLETEEYIVQANNEITSLIEKLNNLAEVEEDE